MTIHLTMNGQPARASAPESTARGCSLAPTPWSAGTGPVTAREAPAANEARAGATIGATGDEASTMTDAQRAALSALIHSPAERRASRWARRDHVGDVAWAAVLVLLLGLSVDSLFEGLRFVRSADALQTIAATRAHVDELAARAQSSGVVSRTM
jgi:hypothetical protein